MSDTRYVGSVRSLGGKGKSGKHRRILLLGGGVVGIGVIWYVSAKRKQADNLDPTTAADPSIDPNTGLPYDTSGDYSGIAGGISSGGGYVSGTGDVGTADPVPPALGNAQLPSYIDPSTGAVIGGGGTDVIVKSATTDAEWAQIAGAYLINNAGFNPLTVSAAIGKYLAGINLTDDEYSVIEAALAYRGQPPNPPSVGVLHVAPPTGQNTGGVTTPAPPVSTVTKPSKPSPKIASKAKGAAVITWPAVPGATSYEVHFGGQAVGNVTSPTITAHNNGTYAIASVHGTYVSAYSSITVTGI